MAWTLPLFYTLFTFLSIVNAQTSSAVCLPYYSWISNTQGKTPCEIASSLLATCSEDNSFHVVALPLGQHYQGPPRVASANPCMCNTVVFSLMSACGLCQGRTAIRWSEWSANCPMVTLTDFPNPLPEGVRVPAWAYEDVKISDVFDQFLARDSINATESTAIPAPVSTPAPSPTEEPIPITASRDTVELSSLSSEVPVQTDTPLTEEELQAAADYAYANKVAGSIIGSLLGSALIVAVVVMVLRNLRRRRSARRVEQESASERGERAQFESQTEEMKQESPSESLPSIRISVSASSRGHH